MASGASPPKLYIIPLNRYSSTVLPYFKKALEQHKQDIIKFEGSCQWHELRTELVKASDTLKKLQSYLTEVENVAEKLQPEQRPDFEIRLRPIRRKTESIIEDFTVVHRRAESSLNATSSRVVAEAVAAASRRQLLQEQLFLHERDRLEERRDRLEKVTQIERDSADLQEIFTELKKATQEQAELVERVETHVEETQLNVEEGARQVALAARLSGGVAPVAGALIGGAVAGPLGLLAGAEIGSLAAVSGGVLGYVGGQLVNAGRRRGTSPPPAGAATAAPPVARPPSAPAALVARPGGGAAAATADSPRRLPERPLDPVLSDDVEEAEDALVVAADADADAALRPR